MKVLHIANLGQGGITKMLIELSNYQMKHQNITVNVMMPLNRKMYHLNLLDRKINIIVGNLSSGYEINLYKFYKLSKIFYGYDILHFHFFNPILLIFAWITGRKILYTEHGTFKKTNQIDSIKNFIKKKIIGRFLLGKIPDAIIFNSNWLKNDTGLKNKNLFVIHNGIRINTIQNKIKCSKRVDFIFIGRIINIKRINRTIYSLKYLNDKIDYCFHVVGDGPAKNSLEKYALSLIPEKNIVFYGYKEDIDKYYEQADYFILSTKGEAFGMVLIEAIIKNVFILMFSDVGGALEIIGDINEKIVANDEKEMANNIMYWEENPEKKQKILNQLKKRVQNFFSVEITANKYLNVYKQIKDS